MYREPQEQEVQNFIKRGLHSWTDLVSFHPKMSEVRRSQRLQQATDFSIARILGANPEPICSSSSSSPSSSVSISPAIEDRVPKLPNNCACCSPPDSKGGSFLLPIIASSSGLQDHGSSELEKRSTVPRFIEETRKIQHQQSSEGVSNAGTDLQWLHCTRYRPPRLPKRSSAGKISKRRPGKHPRIPFTPFQLEILEDKYKKGAYLARRDVVQLSLVLRLPQSRVKIWFQNRRARERRESLHSESRNETGRPDRDINGV